MADRLFDLPKDVQVKAIDQQDTLAEDAWELAKQLIHTGECKLKDGHTTYKLQSKDLMKHIQWLASMKAKKPKGLPAPKDVHLKKTSQDSDDEAD